MSAPLRKYLRRMWRAQLTEGALLTLNEAAEALPGSPRLARAWLGDHVAPVADLLGQPLYRWGDVVAALRTEPVHGDSPTWLSTAEAASRLGVSRSTLDGMLARAPRDLPGAPVHVGDGGKRQHLRWDAGRLGEWIAAYRAWDTRENGPVVGAPRPQRGSSAPRPRADGPVDWRAVVRDAAKG